MTEHAFLLLGGNIGNTKDYIAQALSLLCQNHCRTLKLSSLWKSEPWGFDCHAWFINQAVEITTELEPLALLHHIQAVEQQLGRVRTSDTRYTARTIDIDIVFYGKEIVEYSELIIPHKLMTQRQFVLRPLCEICPDFVHPVIGLTVKDLLAQCRDASACMRLNHDI